MIRSATIWLLAFAPLLSFSQGVKANSYDKFTKKQRVETESLSFSGLAGKNKLSFYFTALDSSLHLSMSGTDWGNTAVDIGDELILLFSNDTVVTLKSTSLQGFGPGDSKNTYSHRYTVSLDQLEALNKYDLVGIRKYSFKDFYDLTVLQANAQKLKKLSALFIAELKKANIIKTLQQISIKDINSHIGDSVEFCSKVYRTRYFRESVDSPTLLDLQAEFSDPFINVVILQKDRVKFNGTPEKKYLGKEVCISGVLRLRNNVPHIVLHDQRQIKLQSPVSLEEIELFEGDSVTVFGKVSTARYLENTKTKPTLLNIGAPYPDQLLTLVIENESRKNFTRPEKEYLDKTVRINGKVASFQGTPQIVLYNTEQIQVVEEQDTGPGFAAIKEDFPKSTSPFAAKHQVSVKSARNASTSYQAEFPGGSEAFRLFLRENLMHPEWMKVDEQKQVVASFEIDTSGACRQVKIVKSAGFVYDNEVKRVLLKMPRWKPALRNGVSVATTVTQPVTFEIVVEQQK